MNGRTLERSLRFIVQVQQSCEWIDLLLVKSASGTPTWNVPRAAVPLGHLDTAGCGDVITGLLATIFRQFTWKRIQDADSWFYSLLESIDHDEDQET